MNVRLYWPVWIAAFAFLALVADVETAEPKAVNVCVSVELPKPGRCKHFIYRGYRVSVCR